MKLRCSEVNILKTYQSFFLFKNACSPLTLSLRFGEHTSLEMQTTMKCQWDEQADNIWNQNFFPLFDVLVHVNEKKRSLFQYNRLEI